MSNIKKVVKYQVMDSKTAIPVFYIVMLGIMVLIAVSLVSIEVNGEESSMIGGLEMGMVIFLFVVGLNSFRETFRMMIQNGISRKTMFKGFTITALIFSAGMSLINEVILAAGKAFAASRGNMVFMGAFEQIYGRHYAGEAGGIRMSLEGLLFLICFSAAAMMSGYFITNMYYRMNKPAKIIVSVCVPVSLIIVLPIFDYSVTGGAIFRTFWHFIAFAFGFLNGYNPYYGIVSSAAAFVLFAALSWMLVRKAAVKD